MAEVKETAVVVDKKVGAPRFTQSCPRAGPATDGAFWLLTAKRAGEPRRRRVWAGGPQQAGLRAVHGSHQ